MRAFVTGASGFVGGHLLAHLHACGDETVATDRAQGGADVVDVQGISAEIEAATPDVIYHLAGQADVAASWRDPSGTWRINTEGTLSVLAAAADLGVHRVIVITSAEVYGIVAPAELPLDEHSPLNPASPYAASKAAAEMLCIQWANKGLGVIRARAFNHLGPGQSERFVASGLAHRLVRAKADGARFIAVGNLDARRDFTDVRDVVRAYRLLAEGGTPGEAYNVCSGVDRSIREIAELLLERTDPNIGLVPDPDLQRPSDLPALRGDHSKISAECGWQPEIELSTTLDDIVADASAPDAADRAARTAQ
jgi:GDP-4-dehydro-6-deoxy-D-mannose reductase